MLPAIEVDLSDLGVSTGIDAIAHSQSQR
jgi:hypothetical protein